MNPQNPAEAAALIERLSGQRLGAAPAGPMPPGAPGAPGAAPGIPGAPAGAPPQQAAPQSPPPSSPPKETSEGAAASAGAPDTEATAMADDAIVWEVPMGGDKKRKMTPQQVASVLERYAALNYRHSQYKPVLDAVDNWMKSNPNASPAQLLKQVEAMAAAQSKNTQFGPKTESSPNDAPTGDDPYAKWEEDNAAKLPPGYREMSGNMQQMMATIMQQNQMLQRMLGMASGGVDAARDAHASAQSQRGQAIQQTIGNNLDRAQAQLQLPDESANDFMIFATERGYTFEDFIDPQLTLKVMADFRNAMASPEMERLRSVAQRRSAISGSLGATPSAGAPTPAAPPSSFDRLVNSAMSKKQLG